MYKLPQFPLSKTWKRKFRKYQKAQNDSEEAD